MIKYDQHVHTRFSSDSEELPVNHIKRAMELGFDGLCFTDHMDLDYPYEPKGLFTFDVPSYFSEMNALRQQYEKKIFVGHGIEVGLRNEPGECESNRERLNRIVSENAFDFVIGSVHLLDNLDVAYGEYWQNNSLRAALERYFTATKFCIGYYDCFDSLGHLDYIVRYYPGNKADYSPADYSDITDEILKALINKSKALEVNTKSLKPEYGLGATNPGKSVIKRYRELGGELLTIGSDSHNMNDFAGNFDKAAAVLADCGVKYYTVFKKRVPGMVKL